MTPDLERLAALSTLSCDALVLADASGHIEWVSPSMAALLGYGSDDLRGRRVDDLVEPDALEAWEAFVHDLETRPRRPDAARRAVAAVAEDGSRGRLAGGIAHDFNNLLAAIRGNAELLLHLTARDPNIVAELDEIVRSSDRAAALTRQLLAFSRKHTVELGPLDLNEVVEAVERLLRRRVGANVELTLALAPSLPEVMADRRQVEQVLLSLVGNARDALRDGGRIGLSTVNVVLVAGRAETTRTGLPAGRYVCLEVVDNGGAHHGRRGRNRSRIDRPPVESDPRPIVTLDLSPLDPVARRHVMREFTGSISTRGCSSASWPSSRSTRCSTWRRCCRRGRSSRRSTAHQVNVEGTLHLLEFAQREASRTAAGAVLYPSSIAAYGLPDLDDEGRAGRVREDDYNTPTTMYGCNKLYCEQLGRTTRGTTSSSPPSRGGRVDFRCVRSPG
jgi:PAS domain S-box-containing protein